MAENTNKLGEMTKSSLESIRSLLDANTIVGDPIETSSGTCIIPISKISVGYASGGVDYAQKEAAAKQGNFGGGGGTGLTVTPVAFLVVTASGETRLLNVGSEYAGGAKIAGTVSDIDKALDDVPEIITKVKGIFKKDKGEESPAEEAPAEE